MVRFDQTYTERLKQITTMNKHDYGSAEFYAELFSDILADAQSENPQIGNNIVAGFKLAISEWREYHRNQAEEYDRLYFEKE